MTAMASAGSGRPAEIEDQAARIPSANDAATDRPIIASGGVSTLDDLRALATLEPIGVDGVIAGKALYAGAFTVREALEVLVAASL